ncbi:MAG TPA: gamma-glutamyl-gamma-aminobutyrate hydrolase family protein [Microbacteriaceae bacterium]|nr:gamma-glutamyl-gamma-aminobutyrate hydrolase family protein [Microbacteriaceae bacterium]
METRPRIAILGRFAEHTSATRYTAIVTATKLANVVWEAGGEPLTMLPVPGSDWNERLRGIDGVLMPGGADVDPASYGEAISSEHVYGVNPVQDEVDISLVRWAFANRIPVLTICRGTQIANVARGGTLHQHLDEPHLHHVSHVTVDEDTEALGLPSATLTASCYHHQALNALGDGVVPIAHAEEGHIEAVRYEGAGWAFGLQWHPEDNFENEPAQLAIVRAFIDAARSSRAPR